jgi:hypothetical protein
MPDKAEEAMMKRRRFVQAPEFPDFLIGASPRESGRVRHRAATRRRGL